MKIFLNRNLKLTFYFIHKINHYSNHEATFMSMTHLKSSKAEGHLFSYEFKVFLLN